MANPKNAPIPVTKVSGSRESVGEFHSKRALGPTHVSLWEYDWTHSADEENPRHELGKGHESGYRRKIFVHSQGAEVGGYKRGSVRAHTELYVKEQAQHLLEQAQVDQETFSGSSNVVTLRAGGKFVLDTDPGTRYLAIKARHSGIYPKAGYGRDLQSPKEMMGRDGHRNKFECIPLAVPHRQYAPIPRPRIEGSVLATVVGPYSQDVHTDPHGRVRIRFHWDRKSKRVDSKRLCWARVSQAWAGKGFGTMFIPRIGMEVIVSFIEGDPDRPIVMGCVYNDVNFPPLTLEEDQTKSIICTRSSPQEKGQPLGYNSIEFEDMADQELFSIHAQRDMKEVVLHDHMVTVKNDETITIGTPRADSECKRRKTVNGDEVIEVKGERTTTVAKKESQTFEDEYDLAVAKKVTHDFQGEHQQTVHKKVTQTFEDDHEQAVKGQQTLSVEKDKSEHVQGTFELTTDKKFLLTQGGTKLGFSQNKVTLEAGSTLTIKRGGATITIEDSGNIVFKTSGTMSLEAGGSKVVVSSSGITLSGKNSKVEVP